MKFGYEIMKPELYIYIYDIILINDIFSMGIEKMYF